MSAQQSTGVYLLGEDSTNTRTPNDRIPQCDHPWIDGFAARIGVRDLNPFAGTYDFRLIDDGIRRMQAMHKKYAFQLRVQEVPIWVVNNATERYTTPVPLKGNAIRHTLTCCPWDQPSLAWYRQFLHALAEHKIDGIALRDHPALGPIRCSVLGREHTGRENHDSLRAITGYTRVRYVKAVDDCLGAIRAEFPGRAIHTGYFEVKDNTKKPTLDSLLIPIVAAHGIGFFEELLNRDKPANEGTYAKNLRTGRSLGSFVAFQAIGKWIDHSPGEWTAGDDSPDNGFRHGFNDFGARYFEIYMPDLQHEPWEAMFREWQKLSEGPLNGFCTQGIL